MYKSLRPLKKITAGGIQQLWRALDTPVRATSLSHPQRELRPLNTSPAAPSQQTLLSCGQMGDILNLCLASPLVSKQNNFCE